MQAQGVPRVIFVSQDLVWAASRVGGCQSTPPPPHSICLIHTPASASWSSLPLSSQSERSRLLASAATRLPRSKGPGRALVWQHLAELRAPNAVEESVDGSL
jgi:hypothetical protein